MERKFPQFLEALSPQFIPNNMDAKRRQLTPSDVEQMTPQFIQPPMQWEPEACEKLNDVPKVFLQRKVTDIAQRAHSYGLSSVSAEFMETLQWARK